jgi:hypothetical protein
MSKFDQPGAARRRAQELLSRKETERISTRDKERQAQDAKIARLREMRLAKEASDKAAGVVLKRARHKTA